MLKILIYVDEGVDGTSLKHLKYSLKNAIDTQQCSVSRIDAKGLIETDWEEDTALLIFPGGRDVFYHASLDGSGTDRIAHWVKNAGNYLGICAGAYFASAEIEFEKGGFLETCGKRSLQFFPGTAVGSAYGRDKYSYENTKGVEAAFISSDLGNCRVYFNGGCFFDLKEPSPHITTLGKYLDLETHPTAVVKIQHGQGKAILSGVHIEYIPELLNKDDSHLVSVIPALEETNTLREELFRSYLAEFEIPLCPLKN